MDVYQYLKAHTYKLAEVDYGQKEFVKSAKNEVIKLENFSNVRKSTLVLKFPGLIYSDYEFLGDYLLAIYDLYKDSYAQPRGYVDKSSIIVVGIAP